MLFWIITLIGFKISTSQQISLLFSQQTVQTLYSQGQINDAFTMQERSFDCTSHLYAYSQPEDAYNQDKSLILTLSALPQNRAIYVTTFYNHFAPQLNTSFCAAPGCTISITHNCPNQLDSQNYFDIIQLTVHQIATFSYFLDCNNKYNPMYFEWGQFIITICATILVIVATLFARFEAFGGSGIKYSLKLIIIMVLLVLGVGLMTIYAKGAAVIFLDVVSWIVSPVAVGIAALQILWAFFRHTCMRDEFKFRCITVRVVDIVSLGIGVVVTFIWWFTHKNWIVSDFITICMVISAIKVFKFTSLKLALISYVLMLSLFIVAAILPPVLYQQQSTSFFIQINNPFQFQIPTITPTYALNCSWISVTSILFPGLLVAYLHRFDKSRATNIYLLTTIFMYFLGSILWNIVSAISLYPIPFDGVAEPFMIGAMVLMAMNRKELRTIWDGTFYDEEFVNKKEIQMLGRSLSVQTSQGQDLFRNSIPQDIFLQANFPYDENSQSHQISENPIKGLLMPKDEI